MGSRFRLDSAGLSFWSELGSHARMTADYQHIGIALAGMTRRLQLCSLFLPLSSRLGLASALDNG